MFNIFLWYTVLLYYWYLGNNIIVFFSNSFPIMQVFLGTLIYVWIVERLRALMDIVKNKFWFNDDKLQSLLSITRVFAVVDYKIYETHELAGIYPYTLAWSKVAFRASSFSTERALLFIRPCFLCTTLPAFVASFIGTFRQAYTLSNNLELIDAFRRIPTYPATPSA